MAGANGHDVCKVVMTGTNGHDVVVIRVSQNSVCDGDTDNASEGR